MPSRRLCQAGWEARGAARAGVLHVGVNVWPTFTPGDAITAPLAATRQARDGSPYPPGVSLKLGAHPADSPRLARSIDACGLTQNADRQIVCPRVVRVTARGVTSRTSRPRATHDVDERGDEDQHDAKTAAPAGQTICLSAFLRQSAGIN